MISVFFSVFPNNCRDHIFDRDSMFLLCDCVVLCDSADGADNNTLAKVDTFCSCVLALDSSTALLENTILCSCSSMKTCSMVFILD